MGGFAGRCVVCVGVDRVICVGAAVGRIKWGSCGGKMVRPWAQGRRRGRRQVGSERSIV